jgi:hypothetical protein
MRTLITLFSFILLCNNLKAQAFSKGYIVFYNGEKKIGYIQNVENKKANHECFFRESENTKVHLYTPTDISEYGFDDFKHYKTAKITIDSKEMNLFVEILVRGRASLFLHNKTFYIQKDSATLHALIQKDTMIYSKKGHYRYIKNQKYIPLLKYTLLADCEKIESKIDNTYYEERDFISLVKAYNKCFGENTEDTKVKLSRVQFKFGAASGLHLSKPIFKDNVLASRAIQEANFNTSNSGIIGAVMNLSFPRFSKRLALEGQIFMSIHKFTGSHFEELSAVNNIKSTTNYNHSQVHIPFTVKYTWVTNRIRPFLGFGFGYTAFPETSITLERIYSFDSNPPSTTIQLNSGNTSKTRQGGLIMNTGIHLPIKKHFMTAEVRYEYRHINILESLPSIKIGIDAFHSNNLYFLLGFYL